MSVQVWSKSTHWFRRYELVECRQEATRTPTGSAPKAICSPGPQLRFGGHKILTIHIMTRASIGEMMKQFRHGYIPLKGAIEADSPSCTSDTNTNYTLFTATHYLITDIWVNSQNISQTKAQKITKFIVLEEICFSYFCIDIP